MVGLMDKFDVTYICLGAGVQSTAMLAIANDPELSKKYDFPAVDFCVFADTQNEPPWIDQQVLDLKERSRIPIHVVTAGNLADDSLFGKQGLNRLGEPYKKFVTLPVYGLNPDGTTTLLRRQCTREYKIDPINRFVREQMGYKTGQRVKKRARAVMGISLEECSRMKPSRTPWVTNDYPLVDNRLRRHDCERIIKETGFPLAGKSACIYCPFHSQNWWKDLKENHPEVWKEVVEFDHAIRNLSRKGSEFPIFIHKSCKPIDEVNFESDQLEFGFVNGCDEGHCGV